MHIIRCVATSETKLQITLKDPRSDFTFDLCQKGLNLGAVTVEHFWISQPTLVADTLAGSVYRSIIDRFWLMCVNDGEAEKKSNLEGYILMHVLPWMRPHSHGKVLAGGKLLLSAVDRAAKQVQADLGDSPRSISKLEFRDATYAILAGDSTELDDNEKALREKILGEIFGVLQLRGKGVSIIPAAVAVVEKYMKACRGARKDVRRVMDVLTYEAQTEFHRAYSAVWSHLIASLHAESAATRDFLSIWHTNQSEPSADPAHDFHLFHGKVFALHPCGSIFMKSSKCRKLLGDFLSAPEVAREEHSGYLRWALATVVRAYADIHGNRPKRRETISSAVVERKAKTGLPSISKKSARSSSEERPDEIFNEFAKKNMIICCDQVMRHVGHDLKSKNSMVATFGCKCGKSKTISISVHDLFAK